MSEKRAVNIASAMMLIWLAFYILAAFFAPQWADFLSIIGCTVPMLWIKQKHRGNTFGTVQCNTVIYKKKEYALLFVFCISGCAVLSALVYMVASLGHIEETVGHSGFLYALVFGCFIPAFFEEWLVRGGVLGALAPCKADGVWICGIFFMLMHADPTKYVYAFFAGMLITALVYLTECIYLGMLLHFLNNFASLLLSYLPSGTATYIAVAVLAAVLAWDFVLLKRTKLFADIKEILFLAKHKTDKEILTPLFSAFVVLSFCVMSFRFI